MAPRAPKLVAKSPQFHQYNSNSDYELQYTRLLLSVLGIWPMITNNASKSEKLLSLTLIILSFMEIVFVTVPCFMVMLIRMKTLRTRLIFIGPIGFRISNLLKHIFMMYRSNLIKECVNQIKEDWSEFTHKDDEDLMLESAHLGRTLTGICAIFMFSSGTFFHVFMPLLKPRKLNALNITIRPHLYPGYDFFVDSQATPNYEIIFAAHCLCAAGGYTIVTAACNLAAVFVTHVCGQVQVIRLKLEKLNYERNDGKWNNSVGEQIASIIQCHVKILRFSKNIKIILREICLAEVVLSTIVICWLEFYCLTEWKNSETISLITYFLLLVSLTFNIFMYCYIGEILTDQCESVGMITYMINWHKIPPKNILSLVLIIAMSRYPCKITAGGFIELTIRSFGQVMKTSLAYLNMLSAVAM